MSDSPPFAEPRTRRTLAGPSAILSGVALHSGASAALRILPAGSKYGITFRNAANGQEIAASCANIHSTARCTVLSATGAVISTVEHVLSALSGLGVTDAVIEFEGAELPALDGSAAPYVAAIREVGTVDHAGVLEPIRITETFVVTDGRGAVITVIPSESLWISVVVDYPDKPLMLPQAASFHGSGYETEIAPARTYGFIAELEALEKAGLAHGASPENAFALNEDGTPDARTPLRFSNECARHKLLDLIGDLSLAGRPVLAGIVAYRPSHTANTRLAAKLCG